MAHLTKDRSNETRWVCVYPAYIDGSLSLPDGRKIAKEGLPENPMIDEMMRAMDDKNLALKFKAERKMFSRDPIRRVGRLRVQLVNTDGSPCNKDVRNRKQLMKYIAKRIIESPQRQEMEREAEKQRQKAEKERKEAEAAAAAAAASASSSGGGKKKRGGRGGRR